MKKGNKFLERYPELWVPSIGDRVRVIKLCAPGEYKIGYTGKITHIWDFGDVHTIYDIEFSNIEDEQRLYREEFEII
jgi:hypothetical protein